MQRSVPFIRCRSLVMVFVIAILLMIAWQPAGAHVAEHHRKVVMCDCCLEVKGPLGGTTIHYICAKVDVLCEAVCEVSTTCMIIETGQYTRSVQSCAPILVITPNVCLADYSFAAPTISMPCGDSAPWLESYQCTMPPTGCEPHCPTVTELPGNACTRETRIVRITTSLRRKESI